MKKIFFLLPVFIASFCRAQTLNIKDTLAGKTIGTKYELRVEKKGRNTRIDSTNTQLDALKSQALNFVNQNYVNNGFAPILGGKVPASVLPVANSVSLGLVKAGTGVSIGVDGSVNVAAGSPSGAADLSNSEDISVSVASVLNSYPGTGTILSKDGSGGFMWVASVSGITPVDNSYPAILNDGNTVGWFKMNVASITKDGSNKVSQVLNSSGSANLVQSTDARKPLYGDNEIIFQQGDGYRNLMDAAISVTDKPVFVYVVMKVFSDTDGSHSGLFATQGGSSGAVGVYLNSGYVTTGNFVNFDPILPTDTYVIIRALFNGANSKTIVNGNSTAAGDTGALPNFTDFVIPTSSNQGHIAYKEIIIRAVADNTSNEGLIYNYLKSKYSL